ncbi:alpha-amylase family glycosyl hydrolase [Sphingobium sp. CR28]|uniref:alpha-amylase family glycosyl hydrolase n=1 Tax=Sphingobium sp. CR28 TaxID=3400272 RepID=UPI003FEDE1AA
MTAPIRDAPHPRPNRPEASSWRGAAIYQIYPRSFADSNGDGIGDLPGITARLDHIAKLGIDGIWLSPFYTSPMMDFGYDIADYRDVDPIFGTLADFDALIARAHHLGLKVIVDQVYAHTSDQHPWFLSSRDDPEGPHGDWYVWQDPKPDGTPPNNWQSVFGGPAWTWDGRRRQYYMHTFLKEQPQINGHNPAVQEALLGVARFWLDRGVDGFRLDALNHMMFDAQLRNNPARPAGKGPRTRPFDYQIRRYSQSDPAILPFIEQIRTLTNDYPGTFTVAEVGGDDGPREMRLFTQGDTRLNTAYGFDFLYAPKLTPRLIADALTGWPDSPGMGWPSWAFENHDAPRAVSRWVAPEHRAAFARMKMLLLASLRGNIFLYQGEELGLTQVDIPFEKLQDPEAIVNWPLTLSRDGARTPMPWSANAAHCGFSSAAETWLPLGPDHAALAVDVQEADSTSLLRWTQACLNLRRNHPALRLGSVEILHVDKSLLAFRRKQGNEALLCLFNLGDTGKRVPTRLQTDGAILSATGGADMRLLPPYSGVIVALPSPGRG